MSLFAAMILLVQLASDPRWRAELPFARCAL